MDSKIYVPPIKSQGIKTKLVTWIKDNVSNDFNGTLIEPFMGTGVVAFNIAPKKAILCDTNPHLINFYKNIQNGNITKDIAREYLEYEGKQLECRGEMYYYEIRERFNKNHDSLDFLFVNRACFNGMIRFNSKGEFNVPFCKKDYRFSKSYVTKICNQIDYVFNLLMRNEYYFYEQDFRKTIKEIKNDENTLVYCDPPYIERHATYYNVWNNEKEEELYRLLKEKEIPFILSTWHHNKYRENMYIKLLWSSFDVKTKDHFYHVGAKESNRNSMTEALVLNF